MITRIVLAVVVAIAVGLFCMLLGSVLVTLHVPIATAGGDWLSTWGWTLGVLAGIWYFATGGSFLGR